MGTHYLYGLTFSDTTNFGYIGETCDRRKRRYWPDAVMVTLVEGQRGYIKALEGRAIRAFKTHVSQGGRNQNYALGYDAMARYDHIKGEFARPTRELIADRRAGKAHPQWYEPPIKPGTFRVRARVKSLDRPERNVSLSRLHQLLQQQRT